MARSPSKKSSWPVALPLVSGQEHPLCAMTRPESLSIAYRPGDSVSQPTLMRPRWARISKP